MLKVRKFQNQNIFVPILPKSNYFDQATKSENFRSVFWKNWEQENLLSRFPDLYTEPKPRTKTNVGICNSFLLRSFVINNLIC